MQAQVSNKQEYNITAYSLWDFLTEVQSAVQQGYVLSVDNKHFPQGYVALYTCTLIKEEKQEIETKVEAVVVQEETSVAEDTAPDVDKDVTIADVVSNAKKPTTGRKVKGK